MHAARMIFYYIAYGIGILCWISFCYRIRYSPLRAEAYRILDSGVLYFAIAFYLKDVFSSPEDYPTVWSYIKVFILYILAASPIMAILTFLANRRDQEMQKRYEAYHRLVEEQGITHFSRIAVILGLSEKQVRQDLEFLVGKNQIPDVFQWDASDRPEDREQPPRQFGRE
jgi:hypothetical protein